LSANITLITLGVADVAKATSFYESLGKRYGTAMAASPLRKMSQANPKSMR
jgi:hypothetical protein